VILALASFVVGWHTGIPIKLPVLLVVAFVVSAAATRRLLGVKPRRSPPVRRS
jgi:hypothetical protein